MGKRNAERSQRSEATNFSAERECPGKSRAGQLVYIYIIYLK